jgi:hypothetical protein
MQDRLPTRSTNLLQRTAGPYIRVKSEPGAHLELGPFTLQQRTSTDYERYVSRLLPMLQELASLAPQHEVVVFQQVRPHPEEAAKWPSRRMGCNTDL